MAACFALFRVNSLGDNIVFLNTAQALRRLAPAAHLVILTNHSSRELYEGISAPVTILTYDKAQYFRLWKNPVAFFSLAARLFRFRIDASIVGDDQPNISLLLARLLGGRIRVGGHRSWHKVPGALTHCLTRSPGTSMMQWSWEIARVFCRQVLRQELPALPPAPSLDHLRHLPAPARDTIVIHPGASAAYKRWPAENFCDLAHRLDARYPVVWMESPEVSVRGLNEGIRRVRARNLRELAACLDRALLFVGNNSGPMNLASVLGVPSLILNGPTDPAWDPIWNRDRTLMLRDTSLPCLPCDVLANYPGHCVNAEDPMACMKRWSVDEVLQLALAQIEGCE